MLGMSEIRPVTETLRSSLERDPAGITAVAAATGLSAGNLSRFRHQRAGLNGESIDALAKHYGLHLVPARATLGGRKRSPKWPFQVIEPAP